MASTTTSEPSFDPKSTDSWLICTACGTQFPTADRQSLKTCFICDDPRQFTPPTGQSFTTLSSIQSSDHHNIWTPFLDDENFISITTQPKVAIGQRCILIKTPQGNVLWDCITLLDEGTITKIRALGGLKAVVISHPHYYTTHLLWARTFNCPVYISTEDRQWLAQTSSSHQIFLKETEVETELKIDHVGTGLMMLKLGGHFPGSLVVLYKSRLLVADTLVSTPSGLSNFSVDALGIPRERPAGMNSYVFMWSIPNMIPLPPKELTRMWGVLRKYGWRSTHGAFVGADIVGNDEGEMKKRVLESMQIQVKGMGYAEHAFVWGEC